MPIKHKNLERASNRAKGDRKAEQQEEEQNQCRAGQEQKKLIYETTVA